jgi:antitoxin HicB
MTMSGPILSVKFFHTQAGNEPVRDFLRDLPPEDRKIIGTDIKEVEFGWPLGTPQPDLEIARVRKNQL